MLIGYARVSTQDQNLELQIEALTKAGCKKIFEDKVSGSQGRASRTRRIARDVLREGDTLVVWKLDRLGRSVKHLVEPGRASLNKQRRAIQEPHRCHRYRHCRRDVSSSTSWPVSPRWSGNSQSSEPSAGLAVARQLGRKGGRKRQMTESKIKSAKKLLASGVPPRDVAANLGVSVPTLYRWIPASSHP